MQTSHAPWWHSNPYMSWPWITPDSRHLNPLSHHDQDFPFTLTVNMPPLYLICITHCVYFVVRGVAISGVLSGGWHLRRGSNLSAGLGASPQKARHWQVERRCHGRYPWQTLIQNWLIIFVEGCYPNIWQFFPKIIVYLFLSGVPLFFLLP